ncbi:MAG TPA: hypothetical protein VFH66_07325 [Mycobacteriales bacterium]|nr:hypothetical protein [Mycobacteriales bacterium]
MTELTDRGPTPDDSTWLVADEPSTVGGPAAGSTAAALGGGRRTALAAAGLVAAGALVGAVGVAAFRPHTSTAAAGARPAGFVRGQFQNGQVPNGQVPNGQVPNGQLPNGQAPNGQGLPGGGAGPGGADGEQHLTGVVVSVGSSSIRLRTSLGTASYAVTAQTEIVRNGSVASLSSIRPGDGVFVHLMPTGGNSYAVERLFAQATSTGSGSSSAGTTSSSGTTT